LIPPDPRFVGAPLQASRLARETRAARITLSGENAMLLPIHVTAGLLSLAAGAIALWAAKGSPLHRRAGLAFVVAMMTMGLTGAVLAIAKPDRGTALAGVLAFYLTASALLTVRRTVARSRGLLTGLMLLALAISASEYALGFAARATPNGRVDGYPAFFYFIFGTLTLLFALGDARVLHLRALDPARRLARRIGRMGFAMWFATTSFFLGQAKVFPEPLRHAFGLRAIPVVLVMAVVIYWLVRARFARRQPRAMPLHRMELSQ
jgi:uncharacterized membrane protein